MKNILIVDDDALTCKMLSRIFEPYKDQIEIFVAENAFLTQSIIINQQLDMIFLDLQIPETDGFDFLADIIVSCPDIPVFVMTAFGTPESRSRVEKVANCRYIEKPLDIAILRDSVFTELEIDRSGQKEDRIASEIDMSAVIEYEEQMRIPDHTVIDDRSKEIIAFLNSPRGDMSTESPGGGSTSLLNKGQKGKKRTSVQKRSTAAALSNTLAKVRGISSFGIYDKMDVLQTGYPDGNGVIKIKPSIFNQISLDLADVLNPEGLGYIVFKTKDNRRHVLFAFRNTRVVMTVSPDFHLHEFMNKLKKIEFASRN